MDIIDADGHIVEKDSDLRAYLPEPHCKRSGSLLPSDGQDSLMGGRLGGLEDNDYPDTPSRHGHRGHRYLRAFSHVQFSGESDDGTRLCARLLSCL